MLKVCVTGACGQLAYALLPRIASGEVFGPAQTLTLQLLDVTSNLENLRGVVMELEDMACPLLRGILATDNPGIAFTAADVIVLAGSIPRKPGQELKDLLRANAKTFMEHAQLMDKCARKTVKVLVVGNPCSVNTMICMQFAPSIPRENFTALTRLDVLRAQQQLSLRINEPSASIHDLLVWGSYSTGVVYPDTRWATVQRDDGTSVPVSALFSDSEEDRTWLAATFPQAVRSRGTIVLKHRGVSTGMAGAIAAVQHLRDWWQGTNEKMVIMAVPSDGSYDIPDGFVTNLPVQCRNGSYAIVRDLKLDDAAKACIQQAITELQVEFAEAMQFVAE